MASLLLDLRYALRLLARDRSFTVTAVLTLAVCIAANTAMFGIVRSVLFEPLPIGGSAELVLLYNSYPNAGAPRAGAAVPDYFDRLRDVPALAEQALLARQSVTFGDAAGVERLIALQATPSFFRMIRLQPLDGRVFREEESEAGADDAVILTHGFWQRRLAGDPDVVGRTIRVDGAPLTVVGIAPAGFVFLWPDVDLFMPAAFAPEDRAFDRRHSNNWQMVGRLAAGSTLADVQAQIDALNAANDDRFPELRQILKDAGFHSVAVNLQDDLVREVRPVLHLLWGGVVFVLVIGCANLANLILVRSNARARELATRQAIGAGAGRLARQLVTETMLLAVTGGLTGVLLGWWALRVLVAGNLERLPRGHEVTIDAAGIALMLGITVVVGVLLGLAPVARLTRRDLNLELREEGRSGIGGRRARLVRRSLATAQVAVAFVLLIGAGLLLASFRAVIDLEPGFDPDNVYTARISLPDGAYPDVASRGSFAARALDAVRAIPDVESAGVTTTLPFTDDANDSVILAEGYEVKPGESLISPTLSLVSPGYFESMRIRASSGRLFNDSDVVGSTPTIIIDEWLAEKWWPGRDAVGRRLYFPSDLKDITAVTADTVFFTVIGVVPLVRLGDPVAGRSAVGAYYLPIGSASQQAPRTMSFVIRTRASSDSIMARVRESLFAIDPGLPLYRAGTMESWIEDTYVSRRVPMRVAMAFGAVGLFLAAIGIYGVLAYGVAERRRELGVRMALGGSPRRVFAMVLADGAKIVATGVAIGAAGAYGVGRLMESQLFGVSPLEPAVLMLVALGIGVVGVGASLLPSWRATRIDPVRVLNK